MNRKSFLSSLCGLLAWPFLPKRKRSFRTCIHFGRYYRPPILLSVNDSISPKEWEPYIIKETGFLPLDGLYYQKRISVLPPRTPSDC